jgi:hypothetical protein
MISEGISAPMPCQSSDGHLCSFNKNRTPYAFAPDHTASRILRQANAGEFQSFDVRGSTEAALAMTARAAFFDDAIMPVFCPTGQMDRGFAHAPEWVG